MNLSSANQSQFENVNLLQSMMVCTRESAEIVASAIDDLIKSQPRLSAGDITANMPGASAPFSPEGMASLLRQMPSVYQVQSLRMVQGSLDSFAILSRAQQQLLELAAQSLSLGTQQLSYAMSQTIGAVANLQETAENFSFSNRRSTAQAVEDAVVKISADATRGKAYPAESAQATA